MIQIYPLRIFMKWMDQQIYDVINSNPAYSDQAFLFGNNHDYLSNHYEQYVLKHSLIPILI